MHLRALVVVIVALSACPEPAAPPVPLAERDLAHLLCAFHGFIASCPTSVFADVRLEPASRFDFHLGTVELFQAAFDNPDLVVDAAGYDECLAALAACNDFGGDHPCDLRNVFRGQRAEGEACTFAECADGLECFDDVCAPALNEGDPCTTLCGPAELTCDNGRCVTSGAPLEVGDRCGDVCGPGLACVALTCVARVAVGVGEACDADGTGNRTLRSSAFLLVAIRNSRASDASLSDSSR